MAQGCSLASSRGRLLRPMMHDAQLLTRMACSAACSARGCSLQHVRFAGARYGAHPKPKPNQVLDIVLMQHNATFHRSIGHGVFNADDDEQHRRTLTRVASAVP